MYPALYCHFFPRMDPDRALYSRSQASAWELANDTIYDMGDRFPMAGQWSDNLARLRRYYYDCKARMKTLNQSPDSISSEEQEGGGLKDYSTLNFESEQKELGSANDTNYNRQTNRDDLKLSHDHESEDQSEATSPVAHFKNEDTRASTPASGFNAINASEKRKSTSEAPSLPPQSHTWAYASSPNIAPIRSNRPYDARNESPAAHSMRPPAVENTAVSAAYNRGPGMYGPVYPTMQLSWQQQQVQQVQQQNNLAEMERMKQHGLQGVQNWDMQFYQLGENIEGQDESSNFNFPLETWSHAFASSYGPSYGISYEEPFNENGSNMAIG
jgi:hypothetical protein